MASSSNYLTKRERERELQFFIKIITEDKEAYDDSLDLSPEISTMT